MGRLREPTPTNATAGRAMQVALLRRIATADRRAEFALGALERSGTPTPSGALEALTVVRAVEAELDELMLELSAACVLEGATVCDAAAALGVSERTLARRLPRAITGLRGRHLIRDTAAPHGWGLDPRWEPA